jgi:hypothetical protein
MLKAASEKKMNKIEYYSLQTDEITDVCNSADLLAFVRYISDGKSSK